jgi:molecular chaperone GrpE
MVNMPGFNEFPENEKENGSDLQASEEGENLSHETEKQSTDASSTTSEGNDDALKEELTELKDRYIRALAEMENSKRRHDKERQDLLKFGNESIMRDFLPVLDGVENAFQQVQNAPSSDNQVVLEGLNLIHKQLTDVLRKHGLEEVPAAGADFDPNIHQAIQMIPSDEVDREVVQQVFAKGYTLNGRLIRAAMVSVQVPQN